jgi:hypothetical protein
MAVAGDNDSCRRFSRYFLIMSYRADNFVALKPVSPDVDRSVMCNWIVPSLAQCLADSV